MEDIKEEMMQEVQPTVEENATVKDPMEILAEQYGWNPQKGDKGPKEFIEYALQNLEPRGKELKEVKTTLAELKSHMEEQRQEAYLKAAKDIQNRLHNAVQQGDIESVNQIVEERAKLAPPKIEERPTVVEDFVQRHQTLINDYSLEAFEIKKFIKDRDEDLGKRSLSPEDHMSLLERDLYKKFPDYFGKTQPVRAVEKDSTSNSDLKVKKKFSYNDLNAVQKNVAEYLKGQGISVDKYIDGLVADGSLK